jgi:ParB family chromosome partitioning protein
MRQSAANSDHSPCSSKTKYRPEFKVCKYTAEAIITEGSDVGTIHKVCANLACPVHHPKASNNREETNWKVEQEKQRNSKPSPTPQHFAC